MGSKDMAEMTLLQHKDVFADVMNAMMFGGEQIVSPDDLEPVPTKGIYRPSGDKMRGLDRDAAMLWRESEIRIASVGIEDQTTIESDMPLRVMNYDAADYRRQIAVNDARRRKKLEKIPYYPVITFVLYYGADRRWTKPRSLLDAMSVDARIARYVSDYRINVVNLAFLTNSQIGRFANDIGIISRYLSNVRTGRDCAHGLDLVPTHWTETMDVLGALGGPDVVLPDDEEGSKMPTVAEMVEAQYAKREARAEKRAEKRGLALGEKRGRKLGESKGIIATCRNLGATDDQCIALLVKMLKCSRAHAQKLMRETQID